MALITLLAAYGVNAIHKLTRKLNVETQTIKDQAKRDLLLDAIEDVELLATKTVAQIEQTTAKTLREAVKNGTSDRAELVELSNLAFREIESAIRPITVELINENYGDFSKYLAKTIEEKVLQLKQTN